MLADKYLRGIGIFRAIFSSTIATSVAVASLMWLFLLEPSVGVLSNVSWISDLFPVVKSPGLLRDPDTALMSVAVIQRLGRPRASRSSSSRPGSRASPATCTRRPSSTAPAASAASGASRCRCSAPTLLFVVIVLTTRAFQAYGEIDLLTDGGPRPENPTTTLTYLTYGSNSIINNNLGLQAAVAVLLFLVLLVLSVLQLIGIGRRIHYA